MTAPRNTVLLGDVVERLRELPDNSIDAIVTDPPYGLEFMGKDWDSFAEVVPITSKSANGVFFDKGFTSGVRYNKSTQANRNFGEWCEQWGAEALRVLKPGGYLLAFGGTRTYHRLVSGLEDAGFEIRDTIAWLYGSGFPKSLDVSKAIDKVAGAEREVLGRNPNSREDCDKTNSLYEPGTVGKTAHITAPATDAARTWSGFGTALKPAHEPIVVARKPLSSTVAANVLAWGTGALNIDGCRVGTTVETWPSSRSIPADGHHYNYLTDNETQTVSAGEAPAGRWPANVVLDEEAGAILDEQSGPRGAAAPASGPTYSGPSKSGSMAGAFRGMGDQAPAFHADKGGASRFFATFPADPSDLVRFRYCAKASRADREAGLVGLPMVMPSNAIDRASQREGNEGASGRGSRSGPRQNDHPTVKPNALMRWLVRLVGGQPGSLILDPFAGSGSTLRAIREEGHDFLGVERDPHYYRLACLRSGLPDPGEAEDEMEKAA